MGFFTWLKVGKEVVDKGGSLAQTIADAKHRKEEREHGNAEKNAVRAHDEKIKNLDMDKAIVNQYTKEFIQPANWFDSLINGINRIPRPGFSMVALAIVVAYNSVPFVLYAQGAIDFITFWEMIKTLFLEQRWFLTAVVLFYFGARTYEKDQSNKAGLDLSKFKIEKKVEAEIEKEKTIRGVVGDDYLIFEVKEDAPDNVKNFFNKHKNKAIEIEKKYKISALGVIVHGGLESRWGDSVLRAHDPETHEMMATNNIFNIKKSSTWKGEVAYREAWEDRNGDGFYQKETETEKSFFKVYPDEKSAFEDYAKLLTGLSRYKKVIGKAKIDEYAQELKDAGYMTDGKAVRKMIDIASSYFEYET